MAALVIIREDIGAPRKLRISRPDRGFRAMSATMTPRASKTSFAPLLALLCGGALAACARDGETPSAAPTAPPPSAAPAAAAPPATTSAPRASEAPPSAAPPPAPPTAPEALSVLYVTVDSLRSDMPWNGYGRDIAPRMTAFSKEAVTYTRHYSISSYTAMSFTGLLSGKYPSEVSRSGYFFSNTPDEVTLFPELLQKAGVRTMSAHAHFYFEKKAGFHQGFDQYEIVPGLSADNTTDRNVTSPQHLDIAMRMLGDKANTAGRFFAWFHFLDPHDQYMKHEGISFGTKTRDLYDGEVKFVDEHVGKLLDFVASQEWGKRTVVVISSDHGDAFGEHKMYRHGFEIWDVLTHVPLMIRGPGMAAHRIDTPRSSIDLPPTFFELLGMPPDASFQGKSLVPELRGGAPDERDVIIDLPRTSDNDRRRALVRGSYKLIAYGDDDGYALYDLAKDPDEKDDVKRKVPEAFEDMKARYKAASERIHDVCPKNTSKLKGVKKGKKC